MSSPSRATTVLIGCICEGTLYGLSLPLFVHAIRQLHYGKEERGPRGRAGAYLMICTTYILFVLSSCHYGVSIHRTYRNFILGNSVSQDVVPTLLKNVFYTTETVLADWIVLWRAWVVWEKQVLPALLPSLLWLGTLTSAIGALTLSALQARSGQLLYGSQSANWVVSYYVLTFACNLSGTSLLAYRLWTADAAVRKSRAGHGTLMPILHIIVDAGAVYSLTLVLTLICYGTKTNGLFILLDMIPPIIALSFYVVILRMSQVSQDQTVSTFGSSWNVRTPNSQSLSRGSRSDPTLPVQFSVHQLIEQDSGKRKYRSDEDQIIAVRSQDLTETEEGHGELAV